MIHLVIVLIQFLWGLLKDIACNAGLNSCGSQSHVLRKALSSLFLIIICRTQLVYRLYYFLSLPCYLNNAIRILHFNCISLMDNMSILVNP